MCSRRGNLPQALFLVICFELKKESFYGIVICQRVRTYVVRYSVGRASATAGLPKNGRKRGLRNQMKRITYFMYHVPDNAEFCQCYGMVPAAIFVRVRDLWVGRVRLKSR